MLNLVYTSTPLTRCAVRVRRLFGAWLINFPQTRGEQRTPCVWKGHLVHPVLFVFVQKTNKFWFTTNGMRIVCGQHSTGLQSRPHIRAFGSWTVCEQFANHLARSCIRLYISLPTDCKAIIIWFLHQIFFSILKITLMYSNSKFLRSFFKICCKFLWNFVRTPEKHPKNYFRNQENFLKISIILSIIKNLPKNRQKSFSPFTFFWWSGGGRISQNHPETISKFSYDFSAMFSILLRFLAKLHCK